MSYDEKHRRCTAENCALHAWPRSRPGGLLRSSGKVEYEFCNNCLAMRVVFSADVQIEGKWHRITETRVVEPNLDPLNAVPVPELDA